MRARHLLQWAVLFTAWASVQASAHEFWFAPVPSPQAVGQTVALRLDVGEFFEGDAAGFSIPQTISMRHYAAGLQQDLKPFLPASAPEAEVLFTLESKGTHLFTYDSEPRRISLSADKFHAYLHDEGLDFVKVQREKAGTADQPGRERYRRHIKTLIQAGPVPAAGSSVDPTYALPAGQRLELTPLRNPFTLNPGQALVIKVEFDGKPLGDALVKAWHKRDGQLAIIRTRTAPNGQAELDLPYAGGWMVSVVHMVPAVNDAEVDWDSHWGNLSFSLPSRAMRPLGRAALRTQSLR